MTGEKRRTPGPMGAYTDAGRILALRENRLTLIEGLLLLTVLVPLHLILQSVYEMILALWIPADAILPTLVAIAVYGFLMATVLIFLTIPAILGFLHMASEMARGRETPLVEMFTPFSSGRHYADALYLSSWHFCRLGIWVFLARFCSRTILLLMGETLLAQLLSGFLTILVLLVCFLLSLGRFSYTARFETYAADSEQMQGSLSRRTAFRGGFSFFVSFLPWLLLGVLTLGILLLWDTLPRMAVAYFRYASQMEKMRAEETLPALQIEPVAEETLQNSDAEAAEEQPADAQPEAETAPPTPETNIMTQSEEDKNE